MMLKFKAYFVKTFFRIYFNPIRITELENAQIVRDWSFVQKK